MHYKNGREAKVGDQVVGQGYNIKGKISGTVAGLTPGTSTCNIQVLTVKKCETIECAGRSAHVNAAYVPEDGSYTQSLFMIVTEYGTVGDFLHAEDAFAAVVAPEASAAPVPVPEAAGNAS